MELERKAFFERLQRVYVELQEIVQLLPELRQAQNYYRHDKKITPDITIIQGYGRLDCYFQLNPKHTSPTWEKIKVSYISSKDPDVYDESEEYEDCSDD